jgi:hypothetical protein
LLLCKSGPFNGRTALNRLVSADWKVCLCQI